MTQVLKIIVYHPNDAFVAATMGKIDSPSLCGRPISAQQVAPLYFRIYLVLLGHERTEMFVFKWIWLIWRFHDIKYFARNFRVPCEEVVDSGLAKVPPIDQ